MSLTLDDLRRQMLVALFSDDELFDLLVLKGGNALALVHEVDSRATVDLDFSMEAAFPNDSNPEARIAAALERHFRRLGYVVFDCQLQEKPNTPSADMPNWWGGYIFKFKLAETAKYEQFQGNLEQIRRNAVVLGPAQQRTYKIDISKFEFCEGRQEALVDDFTIRVYSLEMIVIEKLRAICQQMPAYEPVRHPHARARDFYDIYTVLSRRDIDLTAHELLLVDIFGAKSVPLPLLWEIGQYRDFHAVDWPSVSDAVSEEARSFDFYFDFVVSLVAKLKAHWNM